MERRVLGVMVTCTTYGTWLRGDRRGWVDDGVVYPPDRELQEADHSRLKHTPFQFAEDAWHTVGELIGRALIDRIKQRILALTVQTWHVHWVVAASEVPIADVVRCGKEAVRYGLRPGRPIWTDGYDKRFCFDEASLVARIGYVERHNIERHRGPRPWPFLS